MYAQWILNEKDFDPGLAMLSSVANRAGFEHRLRTAVSRSIDVARADGVSERVDAVDSMIASRDVEQVLAEVLRDEFGPRYSDRYIPIGAHGVNAWAERAIKKRITRSGLLEYVTSANMPWINVSTQEVTHKLYTLGAKFGWSFFEMQQAQYAGVPLSSELAMATREAALDTKDLILLQGDAGLSGSSGGGYIPTGLINDPDVPVATAATGTWSTAATADQILSDLAILFATFRANCRRTERPDTLLIPEAAYARFEFLRIADSGKTLRQYLLDNIADLMTIDVLPELAGAGAGGTNRAILYAKNPRVLKGVVPMDFGFIADETTKLRTDVYGIMRMVGCVIERPFGMLYIDGIG